MKAPIDDQATFSSPVEVKGSMTLVWCDIIALVIYDTKTGDVVARVRLNTAVRPVVLTVPRTN
jgi:hypothetical protein